jgi:hypothetical protein
MMIVKRETCEWLKETITISEGKERLSLELDTWGNFVEKFKTLIENVQELIT